MEILTDLKVSVIIPTYNRKGELQALLHSLNSQTFPATCYEIIVVDDGSNDGTGEWLIKQKDIITSSGFTGSDCLFSYYDFSDL